MQDSIEAKITELELITDRTLRKADLIEEALAKANNRAMSVSEHPFSSNLINVSFTGKWPGESATRASWQDAEYAGRSKAEYGWRETTSRNHQQETRKRNLLC